jgi:hypothetical protein
MVSTMLIMGTTPQRAQLGRKHFTEVTAEKHE